MRFIPSKLAERSGVSKIVSSFYSFTRLLSCIRSNGVHFLLIFIVLTKSYEWWFFVLE